MLYCARPDNCILWSMLQLLLIMLIPTLLQSHLKQRQFLICMPLFCIVGNVAAGWVWYIFWPSRSLQGPREVCFDWCLWEPLLTSKRKNHRSDSSESPHVASASIFSLLWHFISGTGFLSDLTKNLLQFAERFQQPLSIMSQRKFNPARDRCSVMWDVLWGNLVKMEMTRRKKDQPGSSPSQLIFYVQNRPMESKESTRVIKCIHESPQAFEIYASIEQAMIAYGPKHLKV